MKTKSSAADEYSISTDKSLLDIRMIHEFLSNCYWATNIPYECVTKSIENSLCFGVYQDRMQIGFARVISDFATFAYLGDVFILEDYRGRGLSKALMHAIKNHPDLQNLRRWVLLTRDAHGLYKSFGFTEIKNPERYMEIFAPYA